MTNLIKTEASDDFGKRILPKDKYRFSTAQLVMATWSSPSSYTSDESACPGSQESGVKAPKSIMISKNVDGSGCIARPVFSASPAAVASGASSPASPCTVAGCDSTQSRIRPHAEHIQPDSLTEADSEALRQSARPYRPKSFMKHHSSICYLPLPSGTTRYALLVALIADRGSHTHSSHDSFVCLKSNATRQRRAISVHGDQ